MTEMQDDKSHESSNQDEEYSSSMQPMQTHPPKEQEQAPLSDIFYAQNVPAMKGNGIDFEQMEDSQA